MKGDANLSTVKATYFPPSAHPEFMGSHPPVKVGIGSLTDKGNVNYFQNFRNENMMRAQMPPYDWGIMSTQFSSHPDVVAADKINLEQGEDPKSKNITFIDECRQAEVDAFYRISQKHRNQYRDHSGALHPLNYFEPKEFPYQCPPDLTSIYLKYPTYYTQYRKPIVLPKTLERTSRMPDLPERTLYGRYMKNSDNAYSR